MKVSELKEKISELPDNAIIVGGISEDEMEIEFGEVEYILFSGYTSLQPTVKITF